MNTGHHCKDWIDNIEKIDGPIFLQAIRSGNQRLYDGKPFVFCPWCGKKLGTFNSAPEEG